MIFPSDLYLYSLGVLIGTNLTKRMHRRTPMTPVPREVISGPTKLERANMTRPPETPAKTTKCMIPRRPLGPKAMMTAIRGTMRSPRELILPTIAELSAVVEIPSFTRAAPPLIVVSPAPPQEVQVQSPSRETAIAIMGSKPSAVRKGAVRAAGAPAPAAPSRKIGTKIPMMMSWARRSSPENCVIAAFTSSMAPVALRAFRMVKAPKIMTTILKPSLRPFQTLASRTAILSFRLRSVILK